MAPPSAATGARTRPKGGFSAAMAPAASPAPLAAPEPLPLVGDLRSEVGGMVDVGRRSGPGVGGCGESRPLGGPRAPTACGRLEVRGWDDARRGDAQRADLCPDRFAEHRNAVRACTASPRP